MKLEKLSSQECVPCEGGMPPMQLMEAEKMLREHAQQLQGWKISHATMKGKTVLTLEKSFRFKESQKGADFVHALWEAAEKQGHHPDIMLSYGRVTVAWATHSIAGLSQNDFIMAATTEEIYGKFESV
ncbi:MAG: 4a-hydroxytetrahydrobiopterin dehydratase [Candidatus Aenigmarchaeota archaeon]|nr:4a-hydroxytetrahydrobiopterin dehydratase [Candidatus Aenigmarchaeota archaeon]